MVVRRETQRKAQGPGPCRAGAWSVHWRCSAVQRSAVGCYGQAAAEGSPDISQISPRYLCGQEDGEGEKRPRPRPLSPPEATHVVQPHRLAALPPEIEESLRGPVPSVGVPLRAGREVAPACGAGRGGRGGAGWGWAGRQMTCWLASLLPCLLACVLAPLPHGGRMGCGSAPPATGRCVLHSERARSPCRALLCHTAALPPSLYPQHLPPLPPPTSFTPFIKLSRRLPLEPCPTHLLPLPSSQLAATPLSARPRPPSHPRLAALPHPSTPLPGPTQHWPT